MQKVTIIIFTEYKNSEGLKWSKQEVPKKKIQPDSFLYWMLRGWYVTDITRQMTETNRSLQILYFPAYEFIYSQFLAYIFTSPFLALVLRYTYSAMANLKLKKEENVLQVWNSFIF